MLRFPQSMAEELKALKQPPIRGLESSRSSLDSSRSPSRVNSPISRGTGDARGRVPSIASGSNLPGTTPQMDYVYLKNVLLQFLEQKDKKHQQQLIPVLGTLLHFDR